MPLQLLSGLQFHPEGAMDIVGCDKTLHTLLSKFRIDNDGFCRKCGRIWDDIGFLGA